MDLSTPAWLPWLALAALLLNALLLLALLLRRPRRPSDVAARDELRQLLGQQGERLERGLRQEMGEGARATRQELTHSLASFQSAARAPRPTARRTPRSTRWRPSSRSCAARWATPWSSSCKGWP